MRLLPHKFHLIMGILPCYYEVIGQKIAVTVLELPVVYSDCQ